MSLFIEKKSVIENELFLVLWFMISFSMTHVQTILGLSKSFSYLGSIG